jgi:hypothetical protein
MKIFFTVLITCLMFSTVAFSQVDRSIGREQYKAPKKKVEKQDVTDVTMTYLTKELKLDDFQAAAIRIFVEDEKDNIKFLSEAKDLTAQERKDKAKGISTRIYTKSLPLLSKEQAEKYTTLQENQKF